MMYINKSENKAISYASHSLVFLTHCLGSRLKLDIWILFPDDSTSSVVHFLLVKRIKLPALLLKYEGFHQWGNHKWVVYRENPINMDDLGVPLF